MPPDDLTLAFDTSAAHVAAALLSGDRVLGTRHERMSKGQVERLFPLLEELLSDAGVTWKDLSTVGVGIGPGNFTGIRISVASARGLALSLGIPAVGVTSFEALAHDRPRPCFALIDARRDQLYLQEFDSAPEAPEIVTRHDVSDLMAERDMPCYGPEFPDDFAANIARIARQRRTNAARPAPLYIRQADAKPARHPAPIIVP